MKFIFKNGKVYNDKNEVAVLVSPGHGAGWSTWNSKYKKECMFDPEIVALVLQKEKISIDFIEETAIKKWPEGYWSPRDLKIEWIKSGTKFVIFEYDGHEYIEYVKDISITA